MACDHDDDEDDEDYRRRGATYIGRGRGERVKGQGSEIVGYAWPIDTTAFNETAFGPSERGPRAIDQPLSDDHSPTRDSSLIPTTPSLSKPRKVSSPSASLPHPQLQPHQSQTPSWMMITRIMQSDAQRDQGTTNAALPLSLRSKRRWRRICVILTVIKTDNNIVYNSSISQLLTVYGTST